ncbi:hypothetical protein QTO17_28200, partial [Vibrio owensii]
MAFTNNFAPASNRIALLAAITLALFFVPVKVRADEVMGSDTYLFKVGQPDQLAEKLTQLCNTAELYQQAS